MIENRPILTFFAHASLLIGTIIICFPVYLALVASTHTAELLAGEVPGWFGGEMLNNYRIALTESQSGSAPMGKMLFNSMVMALGIAFGKIIISIISAYALMFFRFPMRKFFFAIIFLTLMLPVEVRIMPTFQVIANLGLLNSYAGLTVPLIASATATFMFRQFFLTIPDELTEAARIDGAGPIRFFIDIVLPLSRTNIAALFVILFIYGWNQYLWPLLITTDESMYTVVMGIQRMANVGDSFADWNIIMATTILSMLPPVLVVVFMQRLFVKGLVDTEK